MENKSQTFLPFTDEELRELNFTQEELDILESASAYSQTVDMLPDNDQDVQEFIQKIDDNFSEDDNPDVTLQKLTDLCKTDPDFINQMIALQEVYGSVRFYPEEEDSENEK